MRLFAGIRKISRSKQAGVTCVIARGFGVGLTLPRRGIRHRAWRAVILHLCLSLLALFRETVDIRNDITEDLKF